MDFYLYLYIISVILIFLFFYIFDDEGENIPPWPTAFVPLINILLAILGLMLSENNFYPRRDRLEQVYTIIYFLPIAMLGFLWVM